jgi:hypothetical protein
VVSLSGKAELLVGVDSVKIKSWKINIKQKDEDEDEDSKIIKRLKFNSLKFSPFPFFGSRRGLSSFSIWLCLGKGWIALTAPFSRMT